MTKQETSRDAPAHAPGTAKGEEKIKDSGKERDRRNTGTEDAGRTARDSTSVDPKGKESIDPKMPKMPPA